MRNAIIALFAVVGFGSGIALAEELKAPACEARMKGVMWNFGSESAPDIRRCDGISYVPYGHTGVLPVESSSSNGVDHKSCSESCVNEKRSCEASCGPSFMDSDCRGRCQRTQVRCETKC